MIETVEEMTSEVVVTNRSTDATVSSVGIAAAAMRGIYMYSFVCGTGRRGIRFRWGFILTVAVFIAQSPLTLSHDSIKPMSAVSFEGRSVRMQCGRDWSNLSVDWEFAPADTNKTSFIYTNRQIPANLTSRYRIDTDNQSRYDLVIDSVVRSDAGTYICTPIIQGSSYASSASAQLMVLESDPVCTTNASSSNGSIVEGDYLELWCTVNYTGNWLPYMVWNSTAMERHLTYTSETTRATSSLTIPLYSIDDGFTLACNTSFNSTNYKHARTPREGEDTATNVPDYQYLWTFNPRVLYGPKNISATPSKGVERIVCWANGNPAPAYEWMDIGTNKTISGSVLTIDDSLRSNKTHHFRCEAYNTVAGVRNQISRTIAFTAGVRNQISRTISFTAEAVASSTASSASLIAVIALGIAVVLSVKV